MRGHSSLSYLSQVFPQTWIKPHQTNRHYSASLCLSPYLPSNFFCSSHSKYEHNTGACQDQSVLFQKKPKNRLPHADAFHHLVLRQTECQLNLTYILHEVACSEILMLEIFSPPERIIFLLTIGKSDNCTPRY